MKKIPFKIGSGLYVPFTDYQKRCAELEAENKRLLAMVRHENREKGNSFNEWWKRYRMALNQQHGGEIDTATARRIWDAAYELARAAALDEA